MNINLSVDESVAQHAQDAAHRMGKSLDQVMCDYLEQLAGDARQGQRWLLFEDRNPSSHAKLGSWHFSRNDVYER